MPIRADEVVGRLGRAGHGLLIVGRLKQLPVDFGEACQNAAELEMVAGHGTDLGDEVQADVFGDGFLVDLGGEVKAALGGVLMEGALEQFEGGIGLADELFLAD
jgi:hypothetical protein